MHTTKKSQREVSRATGIEYTALNQFLGNKKGMWYSRVQKVLDYVGLSAVGTIPESTSQDIKTVAWMEIRVRKLGMKNVADDIGVSYNMLYGFLNEKHNMAIDNVERLMEHLDIRLKPND